MVKIKIIFIVHNIATIDCLVPLIRLMFLHSRFEVVVFSIPKHFPGDNGFNGEDVVHNALEDFGIAHRRLNFKDDFDGLKILKKLKPDIIFRQSPWDADIPEAYSTHNLNFCQLCYIPYYGVHITDAGDLDFIHENQDFHRACWKIFIDKDTEHYYKKIGYHHWSKVVVTGSPKYEYLADILKSKKSINTRKRIIWDGHHIMQ